MKEKGQVLVVLAGILMLIGVFFVGWIVGYKWDRDRDNFLDNEKIIVTIGDTLEPGKKYTSEIIVDNCQSSVPSTLTVKRENSFQQLFAVDTGKEIEVGLRNAIFLKLQESLGVENGTIIKASNDFSFNSPPQAISVHTITWKEELRTGNVEYLNHKYPFSFLDNIQAGQSSKQESCQ